MKTITLISALVMSSQVMATQVFVKSLDGGMDNAIIEAFNDAASVNAIDDTKNVSLDKIRNAISTIKIDGTKLEISFDDNKLKNVLSSQGIASWSGLDSPVLVWIANASDAEMAIFNGDGVSEFPTALSAASEKNNYHLMFPVMDLDDVQKVNAQTIITHSDENIAKASARYDAKYFVAGVLETDANTNAYSIKWNVFDASGKVLGNGQNTGDNATVTAAMSKDIAKVLMQNSGDAVAATNTSADEVENVTSTQDDGSIVLGPVKGGVRVLITDINSVADYPKIKRILITYGYESDIQVLGYNEAGVIFLIPTGSSPSILDGTLAHATEFKKVGDWTYRYNLSKGQDKAPSNVGTVSHSSSQRVTSSINNFGDTAYTKKTVKRTEEVTVQQVQPEGVPVITLTDDSDPNTNVNSINITN